MSEAHPDGRIRRRAVVVAVEEGRAELAWIESTCRGCVGCGGRCSLFASSGTDTTLSLAAGDVDARPGVRVDVDVDARALRWAAARAYGLALAALVLGAAAGHGLGRALALPPIALFSGPPDLAANLGAWMGLLLGTFLAGRLTKRLAAVPRLRVRSCPESDSHDPKELSR